MERRCIYMEYIEDALILKEFIDKKEIIKFNPFAVIDESSRVSFILENILMDEMSRMFFDYENSMSSSSDNLYKNQ